MNRDLVASSLLPVIIGFLRRTSGKLAMKVPKDALFSGNRACLQRNACAAITMRIDPTAAGRLDQGWTAFPGSRLRRSQRAAQFWHLTPKVRLRHGSPPFAQAGWPWHGWGRLKKRRRFNEAVMDSIGCRTFADFRGCRLQRLRQHVSGQHGRRDYLPFAFPDQRRERRFYVDRDWQRLRDRNRGAMERQSPQNNSHAQ